MAIKKRPAPKLPTRQQKLAAALQIYPSKDIEAYRGISQLDAYERDRKEWLRIIAIERGILQANAGLFGISDDWIFELAWSLACDLYESTNLRGRPKTSPEADFELFIAWQQERRLQQKETQQHDIPDRKIAASLLKVFPWMKGPTMSRQEKGKAIDRFCKQYKAAEARINKIFKK